MAEKRPTSGREALPKALRVGSRQPAPLSFSELQKASSWAWHAAETGLVGGLSPAAPRSSLARCQSRVTTARDGYGGVRAAPPRWLAVKTTVVEKGADAAASPAACSSHIVTAPPGPQPSSSLGSGSAATRGNR